MTEGAGLDPFVEIGKREEVSFDAIVRELEIDAIASPVTRELFRRFSQRLELLESQVIDLEARLALHERAIPQRPELRTVADLTEFVAGKLATTAAALRSRDAGDVRYASGRQIVAFVALRLRMAPIAEIGRALGNRRADEVQRFADLAALRMGMRDFSRLLEEALARFGDGR